MKKIDCEMFNKAVHIYVIDLIQDPSPILEYERDLELAQEMYLHHTSCEPCSRLYERVSEGFNVTEEFKENKRRNLELVVQSLNPN